MADDEKKVNEGKNPAGGKPAKTAKNTDVSLKDRVTKWFVAKKNEYSAEFKRIVWPTREELIKQTVTVIAVSLIFGAYIALLDGAFGFLFTQFARITAALFTSAS